MLRKLANIRFMRADISIIHKCKHTFTYNPLPVPELDWNYLCDIGNKNDIEDNISNRKGIGNIEKVIHYWKLHQKDPSDKETEQKLIKYAWDIPNTTHPSVPIGDESQNKTIKDYGVTKHYDFKPNTVEKIGNTYDYLRADNLGNTTMHRSYYLKNFFADLQAALVNYTIDNAVNNGFKLVSVPDVLDPNIIESCGFKTSGERTQVYSLSCNEHENMSLAGTGEMALAAFCMNRQFSLNELPLKLVTTSRCFRAEVSNEGTSLYRVHQFTKVELFIFTANENLESDKEFHDIISLQEKIFSQLDIPLRILEMSTCELGAAAYRKNDIESWMPGQNIWGEISSASNCTDYQSRRLNIRYHNKSNDLKFVHTLNGTACAIPRTIMTIVENNQNDDGSINIPNVLHPYLNNQSVIHPNFYKEEKMKYIRITKNYRQKMKELRKFTL